VIQLYLDRHHNIEDHESQRLHDELLNLYNKHVAKDTDKHATFLAALRQLRPAIKGTTRLLEWWELLVRPTLDSLGHEKAVVSDAGGILLSVLVYEEDEDEGGEKARASTLFTQKLLEVYLDKTKLLTTGDGQRILPEDERYRFVSNHLESLLVSFGRKRPKVTCTIHLYTMCPKLTPP
jgi:solute carrier family 25 protein 16